jgi:nucleotide-binding universal stress UspA family protein
VPEAAATPDGPALIAYDGSSPAAHETIAATGRLLPGRAALVVHAWDSPFRQSVAGRALRGVPLPEIREVTNDVETWVREEAEATVAEGVELARATGLEADGDAVEGSPAWRVLAATAETRDAAVVVAGSQGHGAVASVLLGSVSAGLVHHAERPTLIVRAPAP